MQNTGRWWEFYLVRYLLGTISGSVIILILLCEKQFCPILKELPLQGCIKDFVTIHYIILAAAGFAFSYIASAPILVWHALRGVISLKQIEKGYETVQFKPAALTGIIAIFIAIILIAKEISLLISSIFTAIVSTQIYLFSHDFIFKNKSAFKYYRHLSIIKKESSHKLNNYTESYKHLREHGNAFLILIMEVILAFSLMDIKNKDIFTIFTILTIWIIPASGIWLLGTSLEKRISEI